MINYRRLLKLITVIVLNARFYRQEEKKEYISYTYIYIYILYIY